MRSFENNLQIGTDLLKYRLSPWWRQPLRGDFPDYVPLIKSELSKDAVRLCAEAKSDKELAYRFSNNIDPQQVKTLTGIIQKELEKAPKELMDQPITVVFPRRPQREQNLLALHFGIKVFSALESLSYREKNGLSFQFSHELFNISPESRTTYSNMIGIQNKSFFNRSRVASPTLFARGDQRRLFLFADDFVGSGGIAMEAASFIEYHGGHLLAVASLAAIEGNPLSFNPSPAREKFDQKYPENSADRKKLEEVLNLTGLSIESLSLTEMLKLERADLKVLEKEIASWGTPVPELTHEQKLLFDQIREFTGVSK
jgi:hypothetical protein